MNDTDMLSPGYTVSQEHVQLSAARPVRSSEIRVDGRSVTVHDHDYFEVFVVVEGTGIHQTDDYARPAGRGTVGVLAPGEAHSLLDCRELSLVNVYYLAEWILGDIDATADPDHLRALFVDPGLFAPDGGRLVPHLQLESNELELVEQELVALRRESATPRPSLLYLRASLLKLLISIARAHSRTTPSPRFALRDEAWAMLQHCERAVARGQPLDLTAIAERFSLSRDHLCRVFRAATGVSPTAYHARRRVLAAAARLLDPSVSVTEIAVDLGYADTAHLSRHVRRELGVSPREYRRRYGV